MHTRELKALRDAVIEAEDLLLTLEAFDTVPEHLHDRLRRVFLALDKARGFRPDPVAEIIALDRAANAL